ncbi:thiosulfate sulfurtransferase GlpE [Shewanella surugensis]|uniref:Thiosulfate sulfurtransferase GlpE n=1 Tax=Shewanella surugensis TaxID=212020 RepID=A0ABT0L9R1_9GAMM|nr:thiosulfate sulfurtransferase GlpE [Shewanella surugensis]MCL1124421.1 thiosulfate sulfurtransferase GlpE [Shewanella surugensis]
MSDFEHLSINQLIQMKEASPDLQIVDIRDNVSFEKDHIPQSSNLSNENIAHFIGDANMDLPLIVVCYHGISSQNAAQYLHQQGFDQVYSLDGGFEAWQQAHI